MLAKTFADDGRQWFILTCEPNKERIATAHLIGRRFQPYLPTETKIKDYKIRSWLGIGHRQRHQVEPIFRGLVFIRFSFELDRDKRGRLQGCPGVHKFLRIGMDYAILSDLDMDEIRRIEYDLAAPPQVGAITCQFYPGQKLRITDGVGSDQTGIFKTFDMKRRIVWLETRFGRLSVKACQVEAA